MQRKGSTDRGARDRQGAAAQALIDAVSEHDLLVVGPRERGGFAGLLLGSVSQPCAQHAHRPVVIVRAKAAGASGKGVSSVASGGFGLGGYAGTPTDAAVHKEQRWTSA